MGRKATPEQIETLKAFAPPGTRVTGIVTKVSRSGMHRRIRLLVPGTRETWNSDSKAYNSTPDVIDITWWAAQALGCTYTDDGLGIDGCGMDMVFAVIDDLSRRLYNQAGALIYSR